MNPPTAWWRRVFWLYAAALFTVTHWPALRVPIGDLPRPDLLQHLLAFGLWTFLLLRCGFFGPRDADRALAIGTAVAAAYAALDECSQGIPALQRLVAWDDLAANLLGVALGSSAAAALSRRRKPDRTGVAAALV
ncbi:MAG: hypothetical protein IBJ11_03725 [Phycisphaerales bacterium]|nr:hypothetical protein [Phycisphaerales bacterium]